MKKNDRIVQEIQKKGRYGVMCKACELAKYTINECLRRNFKIDTPKVQKLLVLMQGEYLLKFNEELFPEKVEIWNCGVAIPEVHNAFKSHAFGIKEPQNCYIVLLDREEQIVHHVINKFGQYDVFEINQDFRLAKLKNLYLTDGSNANIPVTNERIRKVFAEYEHFC